MNNQVKPTDTRKLLDWIEGNWEMERTAGTKESSVRAEMWHEFYHKVVSGDFAPDTPSLPTIKPDGKGFRCDACKETFSAYEWNRATKMYCGTDNISPIETTSCGDAFFVCPECDSERKLSGLEVVE